MDGDGFGGGRGASGGTISGAPGGRALPVRTARPVLVACAHGTRDVRGRTAIGALVAALARATDAVEVRAAYVDVQSPTPAQVLAAVSARPAVLVPLLLSRGYHVAVDLTRAARGAAGPTVVARALGPDDRLAHLVAAGLTARGLDPGDDVRLVAAGSSRADGAHDVTDMADRIGQVLGRSVLPAYLSAADPRVGDVVHENRRRGRRTVAASYLLAPGHFQDRLAASGAEVVTAPLLDPHAAPPEELVRVVLTRYAEAARALERA